MGQKVHPNGFRVGVTRDWNSRWYARKKEFADLLYEDHEIRKMIKAEYAFAGIPKIEIERKGETATVTVHCARPGILIGRKGAKIEKLTEDLQKLTGKIVDLKVIEVTRPETSASGDRMHVSALDASPRAKSSIVRLALGTAPRVRKTRLPSRSMASAPLAMSRL